MSYADICWEYLKKYGFITAWAIHTLTGTTCSHDVIRQLKRKYGENIFTHKDVTKKQKYIENGKERIKSKTYRIWYLEKG